MPPADIPSSPEHHHERPKNPNTDEATTANLEASAHGQPLVEFEEGADAADEGILVEPADTPPEVATPVEEHVIPTRERVQRELDQELDEVCEDFAEHRANFAGMAFAAGPQGPTQETADKLVHVVDDITANRPVDDPERGKRLHVSDSPEVILRDTRNTDFDKNAVGSTRLYAEVRCKRVVKPEEATESDKAAVTDESDQSDTPEEDSTVKSLQITLEGESPSRKWAVEYSHNPESATPWAKVEMENDKVIAIGVPANAEIQSLAGRLEKIFDYDQRYSEAQREIEQEEAASAALALGERAVLHETAEETPATEPTEQAPELTTEALLERIRTGESTLEETIEEQIKKICEECEFPFKKEPTIAALYTLAEELQPYFVDFDRMVIDDTSGRVPGLIYRQLINDAREAAGLPRVDVTFANGVSPYLRLAPFSKPGCVDGRTLIFTEYSQTAYSLKQLYDGLKISEPEVAIDIASVSVEDYVVRRLPTLFPEDGPRLFVGHVGGVSGDLWLKDRYKGVIKRPTDVHAHRALRLKSSRIKVDRARQDAGYIAYTFSKLLAVSEAALTDPKLRDRP